MVGRQYTSFEKKNYFYKGSQRTRRYSVKAAPLIVQEVVELPIGMATDDYIIDSKNIVCFSGKDNFLSNLSLVSYLKY